MSDAYESAGGAMTPVFRPAPMMPAEIAKAIAQVMGKIRTLGVDANNPHSKYDYVSTDKFFAAIGPLMAEAGLVVSWTQVTETLTTEDVVDQYGKAKKAPYLHVEFDITLAHTSGALWGPLRRSVRVRNDGAQAWGSAQSYILKMFLRGLFFIPTGDHDDVDVQPKEEVAVAAPPRQATQVQRPAPPPRRAAAQAHAPAPAPAPADPLPYEQEVDENEVPVFDYYELGQNEFDRRFSEAVTTAPSIGFINELEERNLRSLQLLTKAAQTKAKKIAALMDRRRAELEEDAYERQ